MPPLLSFSMGAKRVEVGLKCQLVLLAQQGQDRQTWIFQVKAAKKNPNAILEA
jgi:hypothetical protein